MGNLCARKSQTDSDNSDETAEVKAKRNNDSEIDPDRLRKKLTSAVNGGNKDIIKSVLGEIFNTSDVYVKSWSSDSLPEKQENKFEIWKDAMYIAMEQETKHSEEITKLLLDCLINWSLESKMNDLLLHRLIHYEKKVDDKKLRLIEILLKSGKITVNATDQHGHTALHRAHEEKLISLLIRYGADVNKMHGRLGVRVQNWHTILKKSITLMDLDAVDCGGRTALMIAATDNQAHVVKLLLNAGASVNLSDHLGFTALHHALYALRTTYDHYDHFPRNSEEFKKRKEIFTILFDEKCVERLPSHCHWYSKTKEPDAKKMEIVDMLLGTQDIDVNALSFEQFSPLDVAEAAIPQTQSSIKDALKEKGAVLNVFRQTKVQSSSRFHLDVRCKLTLQRLLGNLWPKYDDNLSLDLFKNRLLTLIEAFKDQIASGKDHQGRTALHLVAISFSISSVVDNWKYATIDEEEDRQKYLRDLANTIVKELITIGCSVNEADVYGRTPLHYANFILKDSLKSLGADASIKDKDGNSAINEIPQQSSTKTSDIIKTVIDINDEIYFIRLMNNKQMEIEVQCVDSQVKAYDDRKTVPKLLWKNGKYAFRHPSIKQITNEVTDLMGTIAKEIERLDPRLATKPEFSGSSNEGTRLNKPDEFDFCFVLTKISEFCEVSLPPELPTGFLHLKRNPIKLGKTSEFDSFFGKDEILNTEKLKSQFTSILRNALVNIESELSLDWNLELWIREFPAARKKVSNIMMIKPLNSTSVNFISIDIVPCIRFDGWWPDEAISNVSDDIKSFGCNLIFDRPQELYPWVPYSESCARISFAKAESDMIKRSCDNAREAYMIGKTMIEKSKLTKYILKNCLLYCIEALTPTSEKASQLGFSLEELESKFHQMDRYLWLKCLMKCHLEFVSQDFCPCYFLPNFISSIGKAHLKKSSVDWIVDCVSDFPVLCRETCAFYRCTANDMSECCYQLPFPDPLWERFNRNKLITKLLTIAYE